LATEIVEEQFAKFGASEEARGGGHGETFGG